MKRAQKSTDLETGIGNRGEKIPVKRAKDY